MESSYHHDSKTNKLGLYIKPLADKRTRVRVSLGRALVAGVFNNKHSLVLLKKHSPQYHRKYASLFRHAPLDIFMTSTPTASSSYSIEVI